MLQEEFDTLVPPQGDFNRRTFVRTAVGSGFAAAVLPVASAGVDGLAAQASALADELLTAGRAASRCRLTARHRPAARVCRWCWW